ncbi:hypothetical protein chiPu_0005583 [Chiloscyllium punctatum]|uniref:Uncharacterized protein n=1 Tax=Chiloscyllium punctatum TaxID=137246 RepID=A0A401S9T0_CHIPU|nr:hypothetical protein [Chiloscyllium punctatum]
MRLDAREGGWNYCEIAEKNFTVKAHRPLDCSKSRRGLGSSLTLLDVELLAPLPPPTFSLFSTETKGHLFKMQGDKEAAVGKVCGPVLLTKHERWHLQLWRLKQERSCGELPFPPPRLWWLTLDE